jgi:hypothetical protein
MLTVTDELKGVGLVFTMLKKCFGEDFDAKGNCSQVAFTKNFRVCIDLLKKINLRFLNRVRYLIYQVNSMNDYKVIGKIVQEFKWDRLTNYRNLMKRLWAAAVAVVVVEAFHVVAMDQHVVVVIAALDDRVSVVDDLSFVIWSFFLFSL